MKRLLRLGVSFVLCASPFFCLIPNVSAQTVQVILRDGVIVPTAMRGKMGTKFIVNVRNEVKKVHNFVLPDFFIFTQNLNPGESVQASFTPDKTGRFSFYSDVGGKPEAGMQGTIDVSP